MKLICFLVLLQRSFTFFIVEYDSSMKVNERGGLADEQEYIEVLEFPFQEALNMILTGEIMDT